MRWDRIPYDCHFHLITDKIPKQYTTGPAAARWSDYKNPAFQPSLPHPLSKLGIALKQQTEKEGEDN